MMIFLSNWVSFRVLIFRGVLALATVPFTVFSHWKAFAKLAEMEKRAFSTVR